MKSLPLLQRQKAQEFNYEKFDNDNLKLMSTFNNDNASESEGCVFDDANMTLFVSEENARGIIRSYKLTNEFELKDMFKIDDRQRNIVGDPEGLALYKTSKNDGYLVASSQGNNILLMSIKETIRMILYQALW